MKSSSSKDHNATKTNVKAKTKSVEKLPDGHHVIIDGRKWRATNPDLPEARRKQLVADLMKARREVGAALKSSDKDAEKAARHRVNEAKVALGERGPKWWEQTDLSSETKQKTGDEK